jgi:anti-sigma28 factor (negative regulator of flagellin synthesis)
MSNEKTIKIPVDSAEKMILRHQFLLKEALAAASYHQEQVDTLSKAVKDVTFMLTETTQAIGGSDGGSTGEPASSAPVASDETTQGPDKVETVKKSNLVEKLKQYEEENGKFDIDTETIASFLLSK